MGLDVSVSLFRKGWPIVVIAGLSLVVIVIGGGQSEVSEYRVLEGWSLGPFLSKPVGDPGSWSPGFGDIAATMTRDGRLYVVWTELNDESGGNPVIVVREREDAEWSEPEKLGLGIDAVGTGDGIYIFEDESGRMWIAWSIMPRSRVALPHQIFVSVKEDPSAPWSEFRPVTGTENWYLEGASRRIYDCWNPGFAESNGTVYVYWLSNKNYQKGWIWRSGTRDGGFTWSKPSLVEDSPHYQAFLQTSEGDLMVAGTELSGVGESVWVMESSDLGSNWSKKEIIGSGAFPEIGQVGDQIYMTWQSNRYSPIVTETALRGAGGEPYVWEIQTADIWFSRRGIGDESCWSREAKLLERDSHEKHGILLGTGDYVVLLYVTSDGLPGEYGDPPHQWRVRTATNQEPTQPLTAKKYRERKLEGVTYE